MGRVVDQARAQVKGGSDLDILRAINKSYPSFNPYQDLNSYTQHITAAKRLGIFTIGGGVPRNWSQQVGPYIEISNMRLGLSVKPPRFQYGVPNLPGAGLLGRPERLYLSRRRVLGKIRAAGRGRAFCRSTERRHSGVAVAHGWTA